MRPDQQVVCTWLMHGINCGSTVFLYHMLEGTAAQKTSVGCGELHNVNLKVLNFYLV
jgi:hypothetical protein